MRSTILKSGFYLALLIFAALFVCQASFAAIDQSTIVGLWLFDEGSGSTTADSSGNGHDGEINGAVWVDGMESTFRPLSMSCGTKKCPLSTKYRRNQT